MLKKICGYSSNILASNCCMSVVNIVWAYDKLIKHRQLLWVGINNLKTLIDDLLTPDRRANTAERWIFFLTMTAWLSWRHQRLPCVSGSKEISKKFQCILPLNMKPICCQSKASVVCSVTTAMFIDFCLKKLNVFSQHIGQKTNAYLNSAEQIPRNWNVDQLSV